jgi:hypothetical protein
MQGSILLAEMWVKDCIKSVGEVLKDTHYFELSEDESSLAVLCGNRIDFLLLMRVLAPQVIHCPGINS